MQESILDFLDNFDVLIDVRSPNEYAESHIPNALNMAIFSNDEFELIGKLYRQNATKANFLGASIACKNISKILEQNCEILNHKHKILVYCARGGNRSFSLYQVLKALKLRVERLDGGYKAYRKYISDSLELPMECNFLTLCGNTGCGKSELIAYGKEWSIDLEGLCNHYGSSFGFMAGIQPSVKMFQNNLMCELWKKKCKESKILLIENESKKLGNIILPSALYRAYQDSKKVLITCSLENRINRTLGIYKDISKDSFHAVMERLREYISREIRLEILDEFSKNNMPKVAELLLTQYYDKAYKKIRCDFEVCSDDLQKAYEEICDIRDSLNVNDKVICAK